jgi:hypothetical protein
MMGASCSSSNNNTHTQREAVGAALLGQRWRPRPHAGTPLRGHPSTARARPHLAACQVGARAPRAAAPATRRCCCCLQAWLQRWRLHAPHLLLLQRHTHARTHTHTGRAHARDGCTAVPACAHARRRPPQQGCRRLPQHAPTRSQQTAAPAAPPPGGAGCTSSTPACRPPAGSTHPGASRA